MSRKLKKTSKRKRPLLQHTKARAFSFVVGKFDWGVEVSPTTNALIKKPRISANPRLYFSPHAAGLCSLGIYPAC